ncbi:MAG TPA: hypothetical protein VNO32_16970 [Candidatus Acidoferrum sp.]|jgi:hypothetical protein|nr:hypothetical protein [Candidatus Acidoferrum sp.]
MQARPNLVPAEQHDAKKAGLKEEGGQHLVGQQRAGDASGKGREVTPVGTELKSHDEAGDDAHDEVYGKDFRPKMIEVPICGFLLPQPQTLEHREIAPKTDGDRREDDVE